MAHLQDPFNLKALRTGLKVFFMLCAFLFVGIGIGYAQDDLNVHGVVSDAMSSSKLDGVKVTVKKDGTVHNNSTTRANGKYEFYLSSNAKYEFIFEKEGFVTRKIVIDSKNIPQEVVGAGIIMPTDMTMFEITEAMKDADLSVFDQPIGIAKYDPGQADLVWDFAHTSRVKGEINAFIRDMDKKQKELDKQGSEADKEAAALEAKFLKFVQDGDAALAKQSYQVAVDNYKGALGIKPDDAGVKAKLGDAETQLKAIKDAEKLDTDYNAALDKGDAFVRTEEYDKAVAAYNEALALKPFEKYPKDKVAEVEKLIADRAAAQANQDKFNGHMTAGETAFAEKTYSVAKTSFEAALKIFPDNKEASNKLKATMDAIANAEKEAAAQAQYDALIKTADTKFASGDYVAAKKDYEAAKALKSSESYPVERIEACDKKIMEQEMAAENKAAFDKLMADGSAALGKQEYTVAISKYEEALTIFTDDQGAKAKLKEAQALLAESTAEAEKAERYQALIAEADDAFKSENYTGAKSKYEEARTVDPEQTYPIDQLGKIKSILDGQAAAQAAQEAYEKAMATGTSAFNDGQFSKAISSYQEALGHKPGDKDADTKLKEAQEALANAEQSAALDEQYNALIGSADEKFNKSKYADAKADYAAALALKKDEPYPAQRINECDAKLMEAEMAAENQAAFDKLMQDGNSELDKKAYANAIDKYQEALTIFADDAGAKAKLAEAQGLLAETQAEAERQERYDALIVSADKSFQSASYAEAKAQYEEARNVIPDETYPMDQLAKINKILGEQAEAEAIEAAYNAAMEAGSSALSQKDFQEAITQFEKAILAKPNDGPALAALEDAKSQKMAYEAEAATDQQYTDLLARADEKMANEQLEDARKDYQAALQVKPGESYPQGQIELIDAAIAKKAAELADAKAEAQLRADFDAAVSKGDAALGKQEPGKAIEFYEEALTIIPNEPTAIKKLEDAKAGLSSKQAAEELERSYARLIENADEQFQADELLMARGVYEQAAQVKPSEKYPAEQIKLIDERIAQREKAEAEAEMQARIEAVNALVLEGDNARKSAEYDNALSKYREALNMLPDRSDIQKKIDDTTAEQLAALESQATAEAYAEAIAAADKAYDKKRWDEAREGYTAASAIKSDEQYPKDRIAEIDAELKALADALAAAEREKNRAEFEKLIKDGDKQFNRSKYTDALVFYEDALALTPDSDIALEKIAEVNRLLGEKEAAEAEMKAYQDALGEADALFAEKSYEVARMKYQDAQSIMPNETYPASRISEIDFLLEKQRLADQSAEEASLERAYSDAINRADEAFRMLNYEEAISGYQDALEIKEFEKYPLSQIERAELLITERDEAERRRKEGLAEKPKKEPDPNYQTVSRTSEDQAEAFMRDAREAQEKEKYERIKKQKAENAANLQEFEEFAEEKRMEQYETLQSYATFDEQFKEGLSRYNTRVKNSERYKKALLQNQQKQVETDLLRDMDAYREIERQSAAYASLMQEKGEEHQERIAKQREENARKLEQFEQWSKDNYALRLETNAAIQKSAVKHYNRNQKAEDIRSLESERITLDAKDFAAYQSKLQKDNLNLIRDRSTQFQQVQYETAQAYREKSDEKIAAAAKETKDAREKYDAALEERRLLAEEKRARNLEELSKLQVGSKEYTDYFRTILAEDYPQGVTEESSTLGNKVIITRIVVNGNRGDEYKKVLDKAGNYYFKNGQSISEHTWNRETLDAFNDKDR
jgi:tetratricopeptide (TPR) repeat protein